MCNYFPEEQKYPGDEHMRLVTILNMKRKTSTKNSISVPIGDGSDYISFDQYKNIMETNPTCFCMDLTQFERHVIAIKPHKSKMRCAVCGKFAYKRCGICGAALHHLDNKGVGKGKNCALYYHDPSYLGLCYEDKKLIQNGKPWKKWTKVKLRSNRQIMQRYKSKSIKGKK